MNQNNELLIHDVSNLDFIFNIWAKNELKTLQQYYDRCNDGLCNWKKIF